VVWAGGEDGGCDVSVQEGGLSSVFQVGGCGGVGGIT